MLMADEEDSLARNSSRLIRELLKERGVPDAPEGLADDARWVAGTNDWYVRVDHQWFWSREGKGPWKPCPYGPAQ